MHSSSFYSVKEKGCVMLTDMDQRFDDPPFFSEEWWMIFRGVCEGARSLRMHLWFYDQFGFSGANMQARLVTQHPTFAGQSLERITRDMEGTGVLECPEAGTPLAAFSLPIDSKVSLLGSPFRSPCMVGVLHGRGLVPIGSCCSIVSRVALTTSMSSLARHCYL